MKSNKCYRDEFSLVQIGYWNTLLDSSVHSLYSSAPKFIIICVFFGFVFYLFVDLLDLFFYCFPDYIVYLCSHVALWASVEKCFLLLCLAIPRRPLLGASSWRFPVYLWWQHVSLIRCDPCSLAYVSLHLEERSPFPDVIDSLW